MPAKIPIPAGLNNAAEPILKAFCNIFDDGEIEILFSEDVSLFSPDLLTNIEVSIAILDKFIDSFAIIFKYEFISSILLIIFFDETPDSGDKNLDKGFFSFVAR